MRNVAAGLGLAMALLGSFAQAPAQLVPPLEAPSRSVIEPGSLADDRLRSAQLLASSIRGGILIRSASMLSADPDSLHDSVAVELLAPRLSLLRNSAIPLPGSDAGLWGGRGWNLRLGVGARIRAGAFDLLIAPELQSHQNRDFATVAATQPQRSRYASPWNTAAFSIDLPQRHGGSAFTSIGWGQSALSVGVGAVAAGIATESQWWGPGVRNAIVLGNQAPGFAHLFLRTRRPLRSRLGHLESKWVLGGLTESLFFDTIASNDLRSFNGLVLTFAPAAEPNLTVGLARAVYAPVSGTAALLPRGLDVLRRYNARADDDGEGWDQISSLFFRWRLPESGLETYAEWSRQELPTSVRDFLLSPDHTQGYTLGLQWARPFGPGMLRVQPELTHLEQSASFKNRPNRIFYRSATVPQGYTHRGRYLGAGIGPGSSQWLAIDYLAPRWQAGVFVNRTRWDNDSYYTSYVPPFYQIGFVSHDVSTARGARAALLTRWGTVDAELSRTFRRNFLFQNLSAGFEPTAATDIRNHSLQLRITPTSTPLR